MISDRIDIIEKLMHEWEVNGQEIWLMLCIGPMNISRPHHFASGKSRASLQHLSSTIDHFARQDDLRSMTAACWWTQVYQIIAGWCLLCDWKRKRNALVHWVHHSIGLVHVPVGDILWIRNSFLPFPPIKAYPAPKVLGFCWWVRIHKFYGCSIHPKTWFPQHCVYSPMYRLV